MNEPFNEKTIDTELQVRLMNLVMGEASDFERDQLQLVMEQRSEVAAYYQHLEHLHGLLGDVNVGDPGIDSDVASTGEDTNDLASWKLPAEKRQQLLAVLEGTGRLAPHRSVDAKTKRARSRWYVAALVVACSAFLMIGLMLPAVQSARLSAKGFREAELSRNTASNTASNVASNVASMPEPYFLKDDVRYSPAGPVAAPRSSAASLAQDGFMSSERPPLETPLATKPSAEPGRAEPRRAIELSDGENLARRVTDDRVLERKEVGKLADASDSITLPNVTDGTEKPYTVSAPDGGTVLLGGIKREIEGNAWAYRNSQTEAKSKSDSMWEGNGRQQSPNMTVSPRIVVAAEEESVLPGQTDAAPSIAAMEDPLVRAEKLFKQLKEQSGEPSRYGFNFPKSGSNAMGRLPSSATAAPAKASMDSSKVDSLAETHEDLIKEGRFDEAGVLAGKVGELSPSSDLPALMQQNVELAKKIEDRNANGQAKADNYTDLMGVVDEAMIVPSDGKSDFKSAAPKVPQATDGQASVAIGDQTKLFGDTQIESIEDLDLVIIKGAKGDVDRTLKVMEKLKQQSKVAEIESFAVDKAEPKSGEDSLKKLFIERAKDSIAAAANSADTRKYAKDKDATDQNAIGKRPLTIDEQSAASEAFSTFSLHVSDVSFKLAQTALAQGAWPDAAKIRIEEFVNALDYHDPLPAANEKVACQVEQAIHPFLMQRNLLRISMRTAATGRAQNTPLRLTLLLDNSGSMERPDRRQTVLRAFQSLTSQLTSADQVTLISFANTPRLLADRVPGDQGALLFKAIENMPSEGGTNIEAALLLAREKALEQQAAGAQSRIVLLTDGAVNLGNANPDTLSQLVTHMRDAGIAFDAAGISALDLNDEVLEALTRQGDGRYYLLDSAESVDQGFAAQIAGALRPSAQNVKVQVEFNPQRVGRYKLLGFEKHRLNKEDFRNDQVDAAELAAAEAGVAVYQFEVKPNGSGDVGSVSVRFRDVSTGQMVERRWPIPYESSTPRLEQAPASMQLAAVAALFAAKLSGGPLADVVDLSELKRLLVSLPAQYAGQPRVMQLRTMVEQAGK